MHTKNRLQNYKLMKLEDELEIQESKTLWKWENKKLSRGLNDKIEEETDNLRGRRFKQNREWKQTSIAYRLANRATKSMSEISQFKTKNSLIKKLKKTINQKYTFICRSRNCFTCATGRYR